MANQASALRNIVIERDMPRGYIWAKFRDCWTTDLKEGRFLAETLNSRTGEDMPAAFFTAIIVHDPVAGWQERDVKFVGVDAEAMAMYQEESVIVRLNAEGHISTRSYNTAEGEVARSTVFIKEGTVQVIETCSQSPRDTSISSLEDYANRGMREIDQQPTAGHVEASTIEAASMDETVWPGLTAWVDTGELPDDPPFVASDEMDKAPF